jgi:hypothetical protein
MGSQVHRLSGSNLLISSPEIGTAPITIGQIAEHLRPFVPDVPENKERLRYWTDEGVLSPIKRKLRAGTGRHRKYDVSRIFDAAVLNLIAASGLQMASGYLLDTLSQARLAFQNWSGAALFLEISYAAANGIPKFSIHEGEVPSNPTARISIILNLVQILSDARLQVTRRNAQDSQL